MVAVGAISADGMAVGATGMRVAMEAIGRCSSISDKRYLSLCAAGAVQNNRWLNR
jgi:hypothetical protein